MDSITVRKLWKEDTLAKEWSIHQLSPYIGKVKSSLAKGLILHYTKKKDTILDPYCGAGTIPLEAWANGRNVIANDLNPYAYVLTMGKLFPVEDERLCLEKLNFYNKASAAYLKKVDLRKVPKWVRVFFHSETLRETIAWIYILKQHKEWFLLSCLLGILHHQRPGFLSYPSSHAVPYLRSKRFPREDYPQLYEYRNVFDRLLKKVRRAYKRIPAFDSGIQRICTLGDSRNVVIKQQINAVITSPPYMRQLEYARDNRLRLWFLGCPDWHQLDKCISPEEKFFLALIKDNLQTWRSHLTTGGVCILILGDSLSKKYEMRLPETIAHIATKEIGGYTTVCQIRNKIPEKKRVRKHLRGSVFETILVLQKN